MAAFDTTRTVYGAAPDAGHIRSFFPSLMARLIAWNETRVTRKTLHALSDRELNDIGLSRGDIDMVAKD